MGTRTTQEEATVITTSQPTKKKSYKGGGHVYEITVVSYITCEPQKHHFSDALVEDDDFKEIALIGLLGPAATFYQKILDLSQAEDGIFDRAFQRLNEALVRLYCTILDKHNLSKSKKKPAMYQQYHHWI